MSQISPSKSFFPPGARLRLSLGGLVRRPPPRGVDVRRRLGAPPFATLTWGLLLFVAGQLALLVSMYTWRPQLRDPEYARKLVALRQQLREKPGQPLVLVLGSSRVSMGVRPEVLETYRTPGGKEPVVFNYSLVGSGPILQLFCLDRLLAEGIRPDWIIVEYWPAFYNQRGPFGEENRLDVNRLARRDLPLLRRYHSQPGSLRDRWLLAQFAPAFSHRFILMSQFFPNWLPWSSRHDGNWNGLDAWGWLGGFPTTDPSAHGVRIEKARHYFAPILTEDCLSERSDQALREIMARCRQEGIKVALLYMPEAKTFRAWYPSGLREATFAYVQQVGQEHEVPLIDARDWAQESDFVDGFHLKPAGAAAFTVRFGRDALVPLLKGLLPVVTSR